MSLLSVLGSVGKAIVGGVGGAIKGIVGAVTNKPPANSIASGLVQTTTPQPIIIQTPIGSVSNSVPSGQNSTTTSAAVPDWLKSPVVIIGGILGFILTVITLIVTLGGRRRR